IFLGRYEALRLLGEGGMGKVYLARQLDLGRQVVIKVMHDHVAAEPKFRDRFQRETLLMARFAHPYAVTLYDASLTDGPCSVMMYELLTGRLPFVGPSSMDLMLAHATEMPPRFADLKLPVVIPEPIEAVVALCLEKEPNDRPQTARELAELYETAMSLDTSGLAQPP